MISTLRPIILFELSAAQARAAGYRPEDLIAALEALGYGRFAEVDCFPEPIAGPVRELEHQRNLVALPDEPAESCLS
jgi:hypothetical protein